MSFWLSPTYTDNSLCEVVREAAGDLAEDVSLVDEFTSPKKGASKCFRITYRSMERSLTDEEVNGIQVSVCVWGGGGGGGGGSSRAPSEEGPGFDLAAPREEADTPFCARARNKRMNDPAGEGAVGIGHSARGYPEVER